MPKTISATQATPGQPQALPSAPDDRFILGRETTDEPVGPDRRRRLPLGAILPTFALAIVLSACATPPTTSLPDPTETEPPAIATPLETTATIAEIPPTPAPLTMATPAIVIEPPDIVPTPTAGLPPVGLPPAKIAILRPGPGSQVTSPFRVIGRGGPSFDDRVEIRLIGEDGRVITDKTTYLLVYPGNAGQFNTTLEFDIPLVAETARLEVSTKSRRDGLLDQLASRELVLLSAGSPVVYPAFDGLEKLTIFSPKDGSLVEGGIIRVQGAGWTDSDLPLTVQLIDRFGEALATREVTLDAPSRGQIGTFEAELAYQIPFAQYAHIVVFERGAVIPGVTHHSSVEVYLKP